MFQFTDNGASGRMMEIVQLNAEVASKSVSAGVIILNQLVVANFVKEVTGKK